MVKLRCQSWAERALIPAFIFFFQMLYPFAWVGRKGSGVAAAAGGCMLVRREALTAAGGFAAIRGALIDDCALAAKLKAVGPSGLGSPAARPVSAPTITSARSGAWSPAPPTPNFATPA